MILIKTEHEKTINSAIFLGIQGRPLMHVIAVKVAAFKEAERMLGVAHITFNKNATPNDPKKSFVTSGIRLGTPAMTARGFGEPELSYNVLEMASRWRHR